MSAAGSTEASYPRIAVLGAGAIGGYLGGMMARAGHDVTLVDQWPEHVQAMQRDGLHLANTEEAHTVRAPALHLHELQAVDEPFDVILLAVKAYDTDWAATLAAQYLAADGTVLVCQNGVTDARVAAVAGAERTVGCVITIAVALFDPGHVRRTDRYAVGFRLGELSGPAGERTRAMAGLLDAVAPSRTTDDLAAERWAKLAVNCMVNAVSGISGYGAGEIRARDDILPVIVQLAAETVAVAEALGVRVAPIMGIDPQAFLDSARTGEVAAVGAELRERSRSTERHPPSLLQDVRKGRRTEIEELNGFVAREGRRLGVPTPLCDEVVRTVRAAGIGNLQPDPSTIERLRALVPFAH